jgi:hypothetical protein
MDKISYLVSSIYGTKIAKILQLLVVSTPKGTLHYISGMRLR